MRMKLRTVLNELACTDWAEGKEGLLDEDVLLVSNRSGRNPSFAKFLRLRQLSELEEVGFSADPGEIVLLHSGASIPAGLRVSGSLVAVASPEAFVSFCSVFDNLPVRAAELNHLRDRMFEAFLGSYDLPQFAKSSAEVLGNPVIVANADARILGVSGDFPVDDTDLQRAIVEGHASAGMDATPGTEGSPGPVRHARNSVMGNARLQGLRWATSIINYHGLEMGRYGVVEKNRPITGFDLELIDFAGQLAGVLIDRLGAAGDRAGAGSSVLRNLVEGTFANVQTIRAQVLLTSLPLDVSYILFAVTGRRKSDKDYYARVGTMCSRALQNSLWSASEDRLIVLAPIGRGETAGYDGYTRAQRCLSSNKSLMTTLESNGFSLFVSEPFDDLLMCPGRYQEAIDLEGAIREPEDGRAYYFWEHRFAALASSAGEVDKLEMMLDKRVVAMAEYDREHGTAYLQTAIMGVRYPGSPADAATALNVHRNTYFYRLNKVRELFFIDLKDGDDRLALSFSASIMGNMEK